MEDCNFKTLLRALEMWRDQKFDEVETALTDVQNLQGFIDILRFRHSSNPDVEFTAEQVCILIDSQTLNSMDFWATGHYEEAQKEMEDKS